MFQPLLMSWTDLYRTWRMVSDGFHSPVLQAPTFLPVYDPCADPRRPAPGFDWWPKHAIDQRLRCMDRPPHARPWRTKAGTKHTAGLLWHTQGMREHQHAVYILASLWDKAHRVPASWRGTGTHLLFSAQIAIHQQFPEIACWRHVSREALPVNLVADGPGERLLVPGDAHDLMYIAALEALMTMATWQLIHYVPDPPPPVHGRT